MGAWNLLVGLAFSFVGSIPPGTINLSVMQLSLQGNLAAALRFALAAALVEYPYAWIAVEFEDLITSNVGITTNFQLISALVMILIGIAALWMQGKESRGILKTMQESGFRKGVLISIFNPLAIPFWIGVTAYLRYEQWIALRGNSDVLLYVLGISIGTFACLSLLAFSARPLAPLFQKDRILKRIPGFIFLGLGIVSMAEYFSR